MRDSAHIRIVENFRPLWLDSASAWRVESEPSLVIGEAIGDPDYEFQSIAGVTLLRSGDIAVALGSAAEVRVYGPDGSFRSRFGRWGGGPGELAMAHRVDEAADGALHVWDGMDGRLSVYRPDGSFLRSAWVPHGSAFIGGGYLGSLPDGSLLHLLVPRTYRNDNGVVRDTNRIVRYFFGTEETDTITQILGQEVYHLNLGSASTRNWVIFGRGSFVALRGDDIVYGETDQFEVRVITPEGDLTAIYRLHVPAIEVSSQDIRQERDRRRDNARGPHIDPVVREIRERGAEQVPAYATLPAFGAIRVDSDNNLWIERARLPTDDRQIWHVVDSTGRWLGDVETPAGIQVRYIGEKLLAGTGRDEWDAMFVALFPIVKPEAMRGPDLRD